VGRGAVYLIAANVVFFFSGTIIHLGLGRYFEPAEYGVFGVILTLMSGINVILISGFPAAVSKYTAEDSARQGSIVRHARRILVLLSLLLFAVYFGSAPAIAGLLRDPQLAPYIRVSALAIPAYALYSVYLGCLNGLRFFGRQATVSIIVSVVKMAAVFALVVLGLGLNGAVLGYVLAPLAGLLLAWKFVGKTRGACADFEWRRLVKFSIPVTLYSLALLLLISVDLLAVKAIMGDGAEVGYYTSATTIARVPYQAFIGLASTLLPSISMATSRGEHWLAARYISQSMRYMLILLLPGVSLVSATSAELVSMVYSSSYIEAGDSLGILAFGFAFLTVFMVLAHVIMGGGKASVVLAMALPLVAVDIILNIVLVPKYGLEGAAWATTVTGFIGMTVAAGYVLRRFNALVSARSFAKICLASVVVYVIAVQIPVSPALLPVIYLGLFAIYSGLLLLAKEFCRQDVEFLKSMSPLAMLNVSRQGQQ
jgi:stage V sporulation protein B